MTLVAAVNETALAVFAVVVGVTMVMTYFASKRVYTATDFWAAGRSLTGPQNGFAIAGDYMSAASFLGIAGLIYLFGFDGFLYSVGFLVAFLTVLFLLAERMRNSGKYTIADVLDVPAEAEAGALGGRARNAGRGGLLPDRADGRRGRADRGARGHRLLARGDPHRRVHGDLHHRRRHARHQLGADHQGVDADVRGGGHDRLGDDQDERQPRRAVQGLPFAVARGPEVPRAGPVPHDPARHRLARARPGARDGGPAAHPDALLHRARRQGGARLGDVGDRADRGLLPDDHVPRASALAPFSARRARRRRARAATSPCRTSPTSSAASCSWRSSPAWPSRRSSRWWPVS